jgi:cell wall-associated NlpC family hydrolase
VQRRRRVVVVAVATAAVVGLISSSTDLAAAAPKPPVPPKPVAAVSSGDVAAAQSARDQVAAQVGQISGQIALMRNQIQILRGKAELAEQKYALAQSQLQQARQDEAKAELKLRQAGQTVAKAHDRFVNSVRSAYMSGDVGGTSGAVLTANDPSTLLEETTLQRYLTTHKADAVGQYQAASVARANDQAEARRAVIARQKAQAAAKDAKEAAFAAVSEARQQEQALETQMASAQRQLNEKKAELYATQANRSKYLNYLNALDSYHRQKDAYEAWKRREEERRRAEENRRHHGGGGGGSGGGGSWSSGPSAPSGGNWTAAKGRRAVARAESQLGVPYAWAGGGVGGPSYGVCDGSNGAPNDCHVRGYDCSGLVLYAWGHYWAHYAATQYTQAGSYHPSLGNLMPGDLLFWSYNGSIGGIHHVAIYIGGGQIIQAPESGSYVMISSMYAPGAIFGATRPLT